jgi:multiple sugar transport system substrate-binding protein
MAAFVILAIVGIVVFASFTGSGNNSSVGTVVIWGTLPEKQVDSVLQKLIVGNQALKAISYVAKQPDSFQSELVDALASGTGPDLVLISQESLVVLANKLMPVPYSSFSQRSFNDAFLKEGQLFEGPGGVYGFPLVVDPLVLYYNRGILSGSGIAQPPTTWEALTGLVPEVVQTGSGQNISRSLIALGTYDNVDHARAILSALFLQAGVPIASRDAQGTVKASLGEGATSIGSVSPGEAVVRYYTQFTDPSKVSYTWNASLTHSRQAFLAGDLALYLGLASDAGYLKQANPNLDFDVAPLPQPANAAGKVTYADVYALAVTKSSKNAAGAYNAAVTLASADAMQGFADATGLAPAGLSLLAKAPADPFSAVFYKQALIGSGWLSPAPATTDQIFSAMISGVITGRVSLTQAVSAAERALGAALQ